VVIECPGGVCIGYLSGGVKEFVGFTELDFPVFEIQPPPSDVPECRCGLSFRSDGSLCETKSWFPCPEPVLLDPSWMIGLVAEGDTHGDLTSWSLARFTPENSTDGRVYVTWRFAGGSYTVTLYKDAARTQQVGTGGYTPTGAPSWPQTIQITGQLSGSVVAHGYGGDNTGIVLKDDPYQQKLESLEAALVMVRRARVCTYNESDWTKYGQIKVDFGSGCNLAVAFRDALPSFDPVHASGQIIPEIIGTLRNLSGPSSSDPTSSYSNWILSPRAAEDIDCGGATGCGR